MLQTARFLSAPFLSRGLGQYSTTVFRFQSRTGNFNDEAYQVNFEEPEYTGYQLVLERTANIVKGITERNLAKVLHIHCGGELVKHFGQSRVIALDGITDDSSREADARNMYQYSDVKRVDFKEEALSEYRGASFQFVINLIPIDRKDMGISIDEMVRVTTTHGFVIIGAPENIWQDEKIYETISSLDKSNEITFLSLQKIRCTTFSDAANPAEELEYYLTVFRKGDQVRVKLI